LNPFQNIYDAQKAYFGTGVTRGYEWRVEQLDRMAGLLSENEAALQKAVAADFKTASQEFVFETAAPLGETQFQKSQLKTWMEPVEAPLPKFLAETGHKGFVYRDPYGFWPPSSSNTGVKFSAAAFMTILPTLVLPVKKMKSKGSFRSSVTSSRPPSTALTARGSK
jgi:hypothetical protein